MLNKYEEILQQLEQVVETLGRIIATQEEIDKELGKELDILSRIARREPKNPNP